MIGMILPKLAVLLGITIFYLMSLPVAIAEERQTQLRLSHWLPPSHPIQAAIEDWANDVEKTSDGKITSVIFPAEELGKAIDHYDMTRDGEVSISFVGPGYQPGRFPIIAGAELPFLFRDAKTGTAAVDSWYRKYASRELRDVHYCFAFIHDPGTLFTRERVTMPVDLKGMKIRQPNATIGELLEQVGAKGLQASAPESRALLMQGRADGIFFPWGSARLFGIDRVVRHAIDVQMYTSVFLWVMNLAEYKGLSPYKAKVIDDHCNTQWAVRFATPVADFESSEQVAIKKMENDEIVELNDAELNLWQRTSEPLQAIWAANVRKIGLDPEATWKEFRDSLREHRADYMPKGSSRVGAN